MNSDDLDTELTRASSKGQIVIPAKIRKELNIEEGSLLAVTTHNDMIVLKKISSNISVNDKKTLKLVEEAWKDIEQGKYKIRSKRDFFKEFKEW
ncbi:MAG: AbrB/MazE/SpoVT family DNA-binding domain-containing protein [Candidatus Thermoplasmatota archaeon]|jgi:AbrB family looped-hinge helix DNA binding protein|nr:AbrB/MazE/SpoVT family DNA-binding domain-containing protein [Candidatus Thermoplasmatota archaeon]MCL6003020.1 AbrB/MazE/SpoVT family DNA-binding domain-containing protein [Candidatus Thermoplasmatota archaeon]